MRRPSRPGTPRRRRYRRGGRCRRSPTAPVGHHTPARPGATVGTLGYRPVGCAPMQEILEAIQSGASGDDIAHLPIPESTRAAHVLRSEAGMWDGVESADKDPRKSLHVGEVPLPEIAPDEAVIAV